MPKKAQSVNHIDLSTIKDPKFVKDLSYKELDVLSNDISSYIVDVTSRFGGHLSSNLGVIDATIALCRAFDFSKDKIVFDVGHQCYTYKVLTGRSLEHLREKDGPAGFQRMNESSYDHYEAGHSSTSISAAEGLALARDLKGEKHDVIAFIGDSSIANGLAFEGLNSAIQQKHKIIIVINDNGMSISKPVGGLADAFRKFSTSNFYRRSKHLFKRMMGKTRFGRSIYSFFANIKNWFKRHLLDLTLFDSLGYSLIGPVDGHDIKALEKAFNRAKKTDGSVIVIIKTIKGKGYKYAENDESGAWHGVSGFNKETGELKGHKDNTITWSEQYAKCLDEKMAINDKIIALVPATATGSALNPLFAKYNNRIIDVGISEEHAFVLAGGLAVSGYHPVISIYSTFLQRAYDQISHDLARMNLNATILVDRAGLVGKDGNTHQGLYDEAFLYSIPNTVIAMAPCDKVVDSLFNESFNDHGVFAIRYPRETYAICEEKNIEVPFGKWIKNKDGHNVAVVSVGPISLKLLKDIEEEKLDYGFYTAVYQKPMDEEAIKELLSYDKIVIYNCYSIENGFASFLAARLMELGYNGQVYIKAVGNQFVSHATIEEQREQFGISEKQVLEFIKTL